MEPNEEDARKLKDYEGKEVCMGIRSERFNAGKAEKTASRSILMSLKCWVRNSCSTVNSRFQEVVISEPGHFEYGLNEDHNFNLDVEGLHFFDAETTMRI